MQDTEFASFNKGQTKQILNALDIETKKMGIKEFIVDETKENKIAICPMCEEQLTPENLGNVIKGSKILFCDNPSCFNHYLIKRLL